MQFSSTKLVNISTIAVPQSCTDLDSHADTCVLGCNALITHSYEVFAIPKFINIMAYDPTLGSVSNMPVVNDAVAYDCSNSGEVIILKLIRQCTLTLYPKNLMCNMQLRINEGKLFKCPKYLADNPSEFDHAIVVTPSG